MPSVADTTDRDLLLAHWLAAAATGDATAFERFYDTTVALARAVARRRLRDGEVDDLLADCYFEAWRGAARFDAGRGTAVAWLLCIVKSRSLDLLRRASVHRSVGGQDPDAQDEQPDVAPGPVERLHRRQDDARLHGALRRLSGTERWLVGLAYFRDLSHSEIASCTGMALGTVKSHLLRGQNKLRVAMTVP